MKDLYKQLGVSESSGEADVRAALAGAGPELREAAELILLDPARREVYDRNRQVLLTIGRLRANLGLNLTRFWPRSRFGDFTISLSPVPADGRGRPVDDVAMAWAFGVDVAQRRRRRPWRRAAIAIAVLVVVTAACAALWYWRHRL
jgi:hypothetical protein